MVLFQNHPTTTATEAALKRSDAPLFIPALAVLTWISSMVWTIKVSCRSSMAPSIQLLNGAALLANSRYSWSMVSSSFSVLCGALKEKGYPTNSQVFH